mgnify:CR=1 FL=1
MHARPASTSKDLSQRSHRRGGLASAVSIFLRDPPSRVSEYKGEGRLFMQCAAHRGNYRACSGRYEPRPGSGDVIAERGR